MLSNIAYCSEPSVNGFLSGYIEEPIDKLVDGLNGNCVVHYGGDKRNYKMFVHMVDGKREGEALILNDGMPYLRLEYKNGSLNGVVERMNELGQINLRGHLIDGVEDGFFVEYDENQRVSWIGYYRNGKRSSEMSWRVYGEQLSNCSSSMSGEYCEVDENGKVKQLCLYENGIKMRVLATFCDNVMTEYDANGKRVYEGEYEGDTKKGYKRCGKGKEYVNGGDLVVYSGGWKDGE